MSLLGALVSFRRLERMTAFHPLRKFGSEFSKTGVETKRSFSRCDFKGLGWGSKQSLPIFRTNDRGAPNLDPRTFESNVDGGALGLNRVDIAAEIVAPIVSAARRIGSASK
jgi:hypothetical protein